MKSEIKWIDTDPRSNAWDYRLDWFGFGTTTQLTRVHAPSGRAYCRECFNQGQV